MKTPDQPWTMERLTELATGYWPAAALMAAVELDLFAALQDGSHSLEEIANRTGAARSHLPHFLDALCGLRLLEKSGDRYRIEPSAEPFLNPAGNFSLIDALRFNRDLYGLWGRLADSIRHGKPVLPPNAHLGQDPSQTRRFAMGMHSRALGLIPSLLPALDIPAKSRLLDVGSGPGTISMSLARRDPSLEITLFDLPPILDVARELVNQNPGTHLIFHPGHYHTTPLPHGFDAILFCGALHQETLESAGTLFKKFFDALRPGGLLYVIDLMLDEHRTQPVFAALFGLSMMLMRPASHIFSAAEADTLMQSAGFDPAECRKPAGCTHWILRTSRPA